MKPIPTTGRDVEVRITAHAEKDVQIPDQGQTADSEYLPMNVYVDSETRRAYFNFASEGA